MLQVTRPHSLSAVPPAPTPACPAGYVESFDSHGVSRCVKEATKNEKAVAAVLIGGLVFGLIGLTIWRYKLIAEGKMPMTLHDHHGHGGDLNLWFGGR